MLVLSGRAIPGGGTFRAFSSALGPALRRGVTVATDDLRPFRSALRRIAPGWAADAGLAEDEQQPAGTRPRVGEQL